MKALTLKLSDSQVKKKRQKSAHRCLAKIQTWSTYNASKRGKKGCPVCIMEETSAYSKRTPFCAVEHLIKKGTGHTL